MTPALRTILFNGGGVWDFRNGMPAGSTYTRTGAAYGRTASGLLVKFAANAPQQTSSGLALEPAATNLLSKSQELEDAVWDKSGAISGVSANTTVAPDGTTTAVTITFSGALNAFRQTATVTPSTSYIFSFWAQRATATSLTYSVFNVTAATNIVAATSYYALTNSSSMARVVVPFATPAGCTSVFVYTSRDNGSAGTLIAWQADLIAASAAQSPIITTSSTATRGLPVFTEPVPFGRTAALLTYADASTTLVTGLTPGGTFDAAAAVIGANKGQFGVSELITRKWLP